MMDEFILGSPSALYILTRNLALCLAVVTPTGTSRLLQEYIINADTKSLYIRLDIVLISLTLGWDLDSVSLGNYTDITFQVALGSSAGVIRVG